jgi:hypothetical protein
MKSRLQLAATAAFLCLSSSVQAVPTAYHNPATGSLRIVNDLETLPYLCVLSASQRFVLTPESYLPIPGAGSDVADSPYGIAYFNIRVGDYTIGNVVEPGTPCSDLTLQYERGAVTPPLAYFGVIVCVPEPATFSMVGCGLLGVAMVRHRLRRSSRLGTSAASNVGLCLRCFQSQTSAESAAVTEERTQ